MSAWIDMISDEEADVDLLDALQLARTPHGTVDNVMRVHSLRLQLLEFRRHVSRLDRQKSRSLRNLRVDQKGPGFHWKVHQDGCRPDPLRGSTIAALAR